VFVIFIMGAILNVLIVRKQLMIIYLVHNFPKVSHDKKFWFWGETDKFFGKRYSNYTS